DPGTPQGKTGIPGAGRRACRTPCPDPGKASGTGNTERKPGLRQHPLCQGCLLRRVPETVCPAGTNGPPEGRTLPAGPLLHEHPLRTEPIGSCSLLSHAQSYIERKPLTQDKSEV